MTNFKTSRQVFLQLRMPGVFNFSLRGCSFSEAHLMEGVPSGLLTNGNKYFGKPLI